MSIFGKQLISQHDSFLRGGLAAILTFQRPTTVLTTTTTSVAGIATEAVDVFDIYESELEADFPFGIKYNMSLSDQPTAAVTVTVTIVEASKQECHTYGQKFALRQDVFVFTPQNYAVPQTAAVLVQRVNVSSFEGSFTATVLHEINTATADENYKHASGRSLLVVLVDDGSCEDPNASMYEDKTTQVRKCGCNSGFFIQAVDAKHCDSALQCTKCPAGMVCGFQQDLQDAHIDPGKYRVSSSSLVVVDCLEPATCVGGAAFGDNLCAEGHGGPLCQNCIDEDRDNRTGVSEEFAKKGRKCVRCSKSDKDTLIMVVVIFAVALAVVMVYVARSKRKRESR